MKKKNNKKSKSSLNKKNITKKDREEFVKNLISSTKQPLSSNTISNEYEDEVKEEDLTSGKKISMTDSNLLMIGKDKYQLTPKGILWASLDHYYHIGGNMKIFNAFMAELLKHLSMLASNNEAADMFGKDFNDFFEVLVKTMNLAGKLKQLLDKNGIEFDVKKFLESDIEDQLRDCDGEDYDASGDDNNDDESTEESPRKGKPKKK